MPFSKKLFDNFSMTSKEDDEINDLAPNYKPIYDDDVIECMQFGICSMRVAPPREIPYFHF